MRLTKTFQQKFARMSCTEQQLRIVHLQEVGHILRPKNKLMNTRHMKVESPDTLLICKMAILGWRKQLSKISVNFILIRIPVMILAQHANEDKDVDVDMVAEEEELQALTSLEWTGHQEEIVLKLSHHVTRQCNANLRCKLSHHVTRQCNPNLRHKLSHHVTKECNPNLRCKLSHHVTRQCNPWYHPRLKPKLYQPINPKPKPYHPLRSYP